MRPYDQKDGRFAGVNVYYFATPQIFFLMVPSIDLKRENIKCEKCQFA